MAGSALVGPWRARRLIIGLLVLGLVGYGTASFVYLAAFRVERAPGTVAIGASSALAGDAVRLAKAFVAASPGQTVIVLDPTGRPIFDTASGAGMSGQAGGAGVAGGSGEAATVDPAEEGRYLDGLLGQGLADWVLAPASVLTGFASVSNAAGATTFKRADLLAVPFPSARVSMGLEEARSIVDEAHGYWTGATPAMSGGIPAGLEVIGLGDRTPDRQLLEIGGVYPTLASVLDGTYPLSSDVGFLGRMPQGFLGLPARLPFVSSWLQPNATAAGDFGRWLATGDAQTAFHGTLREITLTAVGDVMLGRKSGREIDEFGLDYPFGLVGERLKAADITFCNLEAPLGTTGTMLPGKEIWLRGKPEYVECLKQAGIDIVNLANNHILDYDSPCLLETFDILDQAGILYAGAGTNNLTAREPAILEADGLGVAFLGYTEFADPGLFWSFSYRRSFVASETLPGCNPVDLAMVAEDIAKAGAQADIVAVGYHWGLEDIPYPEPFNPINDLEAIARQTIDLGADIVLGTHPHAVQGYEIYHGGLIVYSLGNFVNDQKRDTQKESVILEMQIGPSGVLSARVTPCWIESTRPRFMEGAEAQRLLEKIEEISVGFRDHQ